MWTETNAEVRVDIATIISTIAANAVGADHHTVPNDRVENTP
jgi:hypothetical protein